MWPWRQRTHPVMTITLDDTSLKCSWIEQRVNSATYVIRAHQHTPLDPIAVASRMYHPTLLQHQIQSFIAAHQLQNAYVLMAVAGQGIIESLVTVPTANPQPEDFAFAKLKKVLWHRAYLYPHDDGLHTFYVGGISRQLLFQYQLLAINLRLNLIAIIPERWVLLHLYEYVQGAAFRRSALAHAMEQHHNNIHALQSSDILQRIIRVPTTLLPINYASLASDVGLFIAGRDWYGTS